MKRVLRTLVSIPFVNLVLRKVLRFFWIRSSILFNGLIPHVPVSGVVKLVMESQTFSLWARGDDALVSKLYYYNEWEKNVVSWFCFFSARRSNVVDAGANIGLFSILAAKGNADSVIHAFEPNPYNSARLRRNVALNGLEGQIHIHECALGDTDDPILFYLPADNRISDVSSVYRTHAMYFNNFAHDQIQVPCTTIDKFCSEYAFIPQVIKIDVELYELQVLLGMQAVLASLKPVIFCEIFNDEVKRKLNSSLDSELEKGYTSRVENLLKAAGYSFYLIIPHGILHVNNLSLSPVSSMYMLLPVKLAQSFYLNSEMEMVIDEMSRG